jgi:hypothetical protein
MLGFGAAITVQESQESKKREKRREEKEKPRH